MQGEAQGEVSTRLTDGRLEGISVPDLFWALSTARATGVLHLMAGGREKRVYFSSGQITFAASGDPNDRLGELLLRQGTIRLEHFEHATSRLAEGRRLGTILVESGHLSPENLIAAVRDQVRHIVWSLIPWEDGEYRFEEGPLPIDEIVTLDIDTASILLQGMRTIRPFQRIRRSVGPPNTRYQAMEGWRDAASGLALSDGERALLEKIQGSGETVESLCREVFLSNFEIHQALWSFKLLGLARECGRATIMPAEETAISGSLDNDGIGKLLVRLARAAETGILQVCRGVAERTFHLREGRLIFATSNNLDDGLVAYLLRRGMISLRDREETGRRQLSNKRVGQILLEMQVIDEAELASLVREHLLEIVLDTFRWEDGAWNWVQGPLPSTETIILDRTVEDVIFAGIRRIAAWARVREGCGGFATRLELTTNYLEILDRMSISSEDWEMIANLRAPATPLEVCRALELGDFRVCQNLWALRLLGVVHEAPLEVALDAALGALGAGTAPEEPRVATPEPPPQPIAPAAVDGDAAFEITTLQEMATDAPLDERAVPASTWSEPSRETPAPWAWNENEERPTPLVVSDDDERGELVNEAWRLAGDDLRGNREVERSESPEAESLAAKPASDAMPGAAGSGEPWSADEESVGAPFELPVPALEESHASSMDLPAAVSNATEDTELHVEVEPTEESSESSHADDSQAQSISNTAPVHAGPRRMFADSRSSEENELADLRQTSEWAPEEAGSERFRIAGATAVEDSAGFSRNDSGDSLRPWTVESLEITPIEDNLSPELLDSATTEPPAPADVEPVWDAPPDLDRQIARFIECHKIVFRVIRSEVGAGAVNFVRSCRAAVTDDSATVLVDAEMHVDGGWSVDELGSLIRQRRLASAPDMFRELIAQEVGMLRAQIGERRTRALLEQLEPK